MTRYFKSNDLVTFRKGFDDDSFDLNRVTGDSVEITEQEFYEEEQNALYRVLDQLDRGYYELEHYERCDFDVYGEIETTGFYKVVRFVKPL